MEKTGEVVVGRTPCDLCGRVSVATIGNRAYCEEHYDEFSKSASAAPVSAKSAAEAVEDEDDQTI